MTASPAQGPEVTRPVLRRDGYGGYLAADGSTVRPAYAPSLRGGSTSRPSYWVINWADGGQTTEMTLARARDAIQARLNRRSHP